MELEQALKNIDRADNEIISLMSGMISIPAISPESGGEGESKRADYLLPFLSKFDEVKRIDCEDPRYPGKKRSSLMAVKKGKKPNAFWILSHIDTVPAGNLSEWKYAPFKLTVENGKLYGRGTEDDGEAVVASLLAAQQFIDEELNGQSLGILLVADEEVGSTYGLNQFIDSGIFKKGDTFLIPDSSEKTGTCIHTMEKAVLWTKVKVIGKSAHGSQPRMGLNPIPVGLEILKEITDLQNKYTATNDSFEDERSTFTPTRLEVSPGGVNAIPSYFFFAVDGRILPDVDYKAVANDIVSILEKYKSKTECKIEYEFVDNNAGPASSTDTETYKALADAIKIITGKNVRPAGPSGGTCASSLRAKGYDSYCWLSYTGSEHQPNEHTSIDNVKTDAKVMAVMIHKLCL